MHISLYVNIDDKKKISWGKNPFVICDEITHFTPDNLSLQKMQIFHKLLEDIHHKLLEVEREKARWQPVPDVVLELLQDEIDTCKVRQDNLL